MLCAIAKIDSAATGRLINLAKISECFGIPPRNIHGHITLATYIGDQEAQFIASCQAGLAGREKFMIRYDTIKVLASTSIIVAVPQPENTLTAIQKEISTRWASALDKWTQTDAWQAHTTLMYNPQADLHTIAKAMQEKFEPFAAQIGWVEFSRVNESGYEICDLIELR